MSKTTKNRKIREIQDKTAALNKSIRAADDVSVYAVAHRTLVAGLGRAPSDEETRRLASLIDRGAVRIEWMP